MGKASQGVTLVIGFLGRWSKQHSEFLLFLPTTGSEKTDMTPLESASLLTADAGAVNGLHCLLAFHLFSALLLATWKQLDENG